MGLTTSSFLLKKQILPSAFTIISGNEVHFNPKQVGRAQLEDEDRGQRTERAWLTADGLGVRMVKVLDPSPRKLPKKQGEKASKGSKGEMIVTKYASLLTFLTSYVVKT